MSRETETFSRPNIVSLTRTDQYRDQKSIFTEGFSTETAHLWTETETGTETETETGTETVTGTETETETDPVTAQAILHRCRVTGETVDLAQAHQAQEDKVGYIQGPMKQYVPFKLILCSVKI